jgi:hypothetical protein
MSFESRWPFVQSSVSTMRPGRFIDLPSTKVRVEEQGLRGSDGLEVARYAEEWKQ